MALSTQDQVYSATTSDYCDINSKMEAEDQSIVQVYEISNIEKTDMNYGDTVIKYEQELQIVNEQYKTAEQTKKRLKKQEDYDEEQLKQAIEEIMFKDVSFRVASEKYKIPKTFLWRRAKKHGYVKAEKPKDEARLQAIEAIKQNEPLSSISKRFKIAISTLHREKLKLYEQDKLPESVSLKDRNRDGDYLDRLRSTITAVLNGETINCTAKKYSIPKTTLWRIFKKVDLKKNEIVGGVHRDSEIVDQFIALSQRRAYKDETKFDENDGMEILGE